MFIENLQVPFTTLEFVETNPIYTYVDADYRLGQMRVVIRGQIPENGLNVYLSENFSAVTPENATWTFENKKVFCVTPRDQNILNPKK